MSTFTWKKKNPGGPERIDSSSTPESSPLQSPLKQFPHDLVPPAGADASAADSLQHDAQSPLSPQSQPNLSPTMRRYVEDKDFLESYLKRENRFLNENEKKSTLGDRGRTGSFKQPPNTEIYEVQKGDNLSTIALRHNIRNTELKRLNKLNSSMVFPGQVLYVPKVEEWDVLTDKEISEAKGAADTTSTPERRKRAEASALGHLRPAGRHGHSSLSSSRRGSWTRSAMDDEEISDRFIRIRAKFITDSQGVATGMMTVTAQCLMFNPSVLDPLVIERGLDVYSLIIPIESVASCSAYDDFAKLQQKDAPSYVRSPSKGEGSFLLGSRLIRMPLSPLTEGDEAKVGEEEEKEARVSEEATKDEENQEEEFGWNPVEEEKEEEETKDEKKEAATDTPPNSETDVEVTTKTEDEPKEDFDPVLASLKSRISDAHEVPTVAMPMPPKSEIAIPRPSRRISGSSRYFCVRLDGPVDNAVLTTSAIFLPSSVNVKELSFTEEAVKTAGVKVELWFAIAEERIDQLYAFLLQWCPNLHEMSYEQMKTLERDYVLLSLNDVPKFSDNHFAEPDFVDSIPLAEDVDSPFSALDVESSCPLPVLNGDTSLVSDEYLQNLCEVLPRRMISYDWHLIYSTFCHGISLKTLYRNSLATNCPVVVVVRDASDHIFGAMLSDSLRVGEHFYGTGECSMFTLHPEFKHFPWSGKNHYCIKCSLDSFTVGGGEGAYGLWIDSDIYHGSSCACSTFDNEQLSSQRDFICTGLEVWGLY
ncbi:oxidation resistance protein 1-like isoform X2 [Oscarella lobularis]|uniref:oxidation resistance protein 1-like isoform X2 n=1 Tax=Oscarella lobularis TaxID=121494 RepID=UPI003313D048